MHTFYCWILKWRTIFDLTCVQKCKPKARHFFKIALGGVFHEAGQTLPSSVAELIPEPGTFHASQ